MVEENVNLFYIPNYEIEEMTFPEMCYFGENLLFFETEHPEHEVSDTDLEGNGDDYQARTCTAQIKLISIEDGGLLAEREIDTMYTPMVQVSDKRIALYDSFSGSVLILNSKLKTVKEYSFDGSDTASVVLDNDLDTVYVFDCSSGLYSYDLLTGEKEKLIDACQLYAINHSGCNAYFYYTDKDTQRCKYGYVDLETNDICTFPTDMPSDFCDQWESVWLMRNKRDYFEYELINGSESYTLSTEECFAVLSDNGHLVLNNYSGTETCIYNLDGSFVSSFSFENGYEYSFSPDRFLWSDLYGGYLFKNNTVYGPVLMFFDPNIATSGSDLLLEVKNDELPAGEILEPELYERAEQLSEKYDLDIRIGEWCELDYAERYHGTEIMTESHKVKRALDILESALECYPDGFFSQLKHGDISQIRIEIVAYMPTAIGFVRQNNDHYLVAVDGVQLTDYVVFHEFSHVIDNRLEWDSMLRDEAIYSEEQWLDLQPDGFEYAGTYDISLEYRDEHFDPSYFAMPYAITFPYEDRAVLLGTAMDEDYFPFLKKENGELEDGIRKKLEYYSDCIRDCFDTEGWPEVTEWEKLL